MAKGREPRAKQTREGVQITLPGRVLRSPGPSAADVRRITRPPPPRCPYCERDGREGRSKRITGRRGVSYYECLECCEPERGEPTRFKVILIDVGEA